MDIDPKDLIELSRSKRQVYFVDKNDETKVYSFNPKTNKFRQVSLQMSNSGYLYFSCPVDKPGDIRYLHREIAGATKKNEVVHHKNHNKLDNRESNLEIMSPRQHILEHKKPRFFKGHKIPHGVSHLKANLFQARVYDKTLKTQLRSSSIAINSISDIEVAFGLLALWYDSYLAVCNEPEVNTSFYSNPKVAEKILSYLKQHDKSKYSLVDSINHKIWCRCVDFLFKVTNDVKLPELIEEVNKATEEYRNKQNKNSNKKGK